MREQGKRPPENKPAPAARPAELELLANPEAGAKGPTSYTPAIEKVGALLRGEAPKGDAGAAPGAEDKDGGDDAAKRGNGADADASAEARGLESEPGAEPKGGDDRGEDPGAKGGAERAPGDQERVTTSELARALGVKDGEIYDTLAIDVDVTDAQGQKQKQSVTLGDLRRGYIGAENLRAQREDYELEREATSLENMQARRHFTALAERLAPYVPRDVINLLNQDRAERLERERALLYSAVPEWKDSVKHAADRKAMIDYLKPWGFTAADVAAIEDHRVARFVRDQMNAARRTRDAEDRARKAKQGANAEEPTPGRHRPSGFAVRVRSIIEQGKAATNPQAKAEAVGALLREHAASGSSRRER
jgi:hypothetical protein